MPRRSAPVAVPRSRAIAGWLSLSFVLPFAFILILFARGTPLGQGYFVYRWSPVRHLRAAGALWIIPAMALAGGAVWLMAGKSTNARRGGLALFVLSVVAAGAWAWLAPPQAMTQEMFNLTSPSSDGAFLLEAGKFHSLPQYLRDFPRLMDRQTPESMGGTRVLSNPPGMTAFARFVLDTLGPEGGWLERTLLEGEEVPSEQLPLAAATVRLGAALILAWIAAALAAYGLGRVFLSPAGAALFAIVATFNPCTVNFVPGKDPGQLLTINLMLWAWLAGWKWRSRSLCGLAGALLVIGSTFSLIHIWVALAAMAATTWQDLSASAWRSGRAEGPRSAPGSDESGPSARPLRGAIGEVLRSNVLPAVVGAVVLVALAWVALGWNIPLTLLATERRWSALQKTFQMNRPVWYAIGLPIFLLFLSPGLWTLLGTSLRRPRLNFGTRLALCTAVVMALIYFLLGVTYELPRLWVAFLPPLTLGLAIDGPLLRGAGEHRRVARVLVLIVLVQMFFTAFHWTFFDAREAEYRLTTRRFYH
jgi:hypothetical protein